MDNNNIDRLIPVIRVFRRRIFQMPAPIPLLENENPPNLSPNHHFDNNSEMEESDHDNDHKASPFYYSDSDEDLDNGNVINEGRVEEEVNPLRYVDPRTRIESNSSFNMQFPCKIGFRSFDAYLNSSLPMNIISRSEYNKIMVDELEHKGDNIVARAISLHVFVGRFVYLVEFMVMENLGELIDSNLTQVVFGKPFKKLTNLDEKLMEGLITFSDGGEDFVYQMPRTHPRFKDFSMEKCSRYPPIEMLSENDKRKGLKYPHEKNKRYYRRCLELSDDYKKDEATIRWLTLGYVSISDTR
jgi:hypothetical protein